MKNKKQMRSAYVVEIVTPKKYVLNGLWFGPYSAKVTKGRPKKPKRVIVWVHGLGSSMFGKLNIADELVDEQTAVFVFNNRGSSTVARVGRVKGNSLKGGSAHEVFTDCVDDIQGAVNFAKKAGVKTIYLAGHSTGCQKSIYWASKKGRGVKGVIILAPMSDYASERMSQGVSALRRAEKVARAYVGHGRKHELLPESIWAWPWSVDAQRFMSLYSGTSAEEIFTYWDASRSPRTLRSVRIPILVLLAEKEEFSDIPATQIATWFEERLHNGRAIVVPNVGHSFKGGEKKLAAHIRRFMASPLKMARRRLAIIETDEVSPHRIAWGLRNMLD